MASKQEEKRAANARGEDYGFDEEGGQEDHLVIDEEELMLLREMKDLKRSYRDAYEKLRHVKTQMSDTQNSIDGMKQQIVYEFEKWFGEEFDVPANNVGEIGTFMGSTVLTGGPEGGAVEEMADVDAETFLRARKNIDTLHRAKKLEKQRPAGFKKQ